MLLVLLLTACIGAPEAPAREIPPGTSPEEVAAAPVASEPEPDPCPARVDDLPPSPHLDDPRLRGDVVVVLKERRRILRYRDGLLQRDASGAPSCWRVGLASSSDGTAWAGPKTRRGDLKTPEGWYATSDKPWSQYYGAVAVHYPNAGDADAALARGAIDAATHARIVGALAAGKKPPQDTVLGGEILVHGGGSSADWTLGCVAMDDDDLDLLRASLPDGMRADLLVLP